MSFEEFLLFSSCQAAMADFAESEWILRSNRGKLRKKMFKERILRNSKRIFKKVGVCIIFGRFYMVLITVSVKRKTHYK